MSRDHPDNVAQNSFTEAALDFSANQIDRNAATDARIDAGCSKHRSVQRATERAQ